MSKLSTVADTVETTKRKEHLIEGRSYVIHYYDGKKFEEAGFSLFGYARKGAIYVRTNLPTRVEHYILIHEAYHVRDKKTWLGSIGKEVRAHLYAETKDPLGFLATLIHSLNRGRIKTYLRLYVTHT